MKTILTIIILSIIFLTIFRFLRKVFVIKKAFKDAINQQQNAYNQSQNTTNNGSYQEPQNNKSFEKSKFNIEAETVDYEIIEEEKKDEK
ncbi:hypothetical protein [Algoriella sp.]|uniref:hypothetical protein n=1 Tax=Algoriella sp. TaxID=1872434 RepID=UPI002FCB5D69